MGATEVVEKGPRLTICSKGCQLLNCACPSATGQDQPLTTSSCSHSSKPSQHALVAHYVRIDYRFKLNMTTDPITVPEAVKQLLGIVGRLHSAFPHKPFTLDGRLVGDLGEVLVEQMYELTLLDGLQKHYDAKTLDGTHVQIKATMKANVTFPVDHTPDHYLAVKIHSDGCIEEIFNGPGPVARELIKGRKDTKTNLHSISIRALQKQQCKVKDTDKIPRRAVEAEVKRTPDQAPPLMSRVGSSRGGT